jgi:hypothetical protein
VHVDEGFTMSAGATKLAVSVGVLSAVLIGASIGAGQEAKDLSDLGTRYPKGEHEIVPPEQREALGLGDMGWTKPHGKVHPDVYAALEKAEKVKEPWLDFNGFAGTVYVQVHLKHEPKGQSDSPENNDAINELQSKVLSRLGAGDFCTRYEFVAAPGILGYGTRAAIEKLKASSDVVAVHLDDTPFPRPPEVVTKDDLPPAQPGHPVGRVGPGGKTEANVYRALAIHGRVCVPVGFNFARRGPIQESGGQGRKLEDTVLATLDAYAAWRAEYPGCNRENGDINCDGTYGQVSLGDVNPFTMLMNNCGATCLCPGPIHCN